MYKNIYIYKQYTLNKLITKECIAECIRWEWQSNDKINQRNKPQWFICQHKSATQSNFTKSQVLIHTSKRSLFYVWASVAHSWDRSAWMQVYKKSVVDGFLSRQSHSLKSERPRARVRCLRRGSQPLPTSYRVCESAISSPAGSEVMVATIFIFYRPFLDTQIKANQLLICFTWPVT